MVAYSYCQLTVHYFIPTGILIYVKYLKFLNLMFILILGIYDSKQDDWLRLSSRENL